MCVSKVQQVTAIDNAGPPSEARMDLGDRLYRAVSASFRRKHGILRMPSLSEIESGKMPPNHEPEKYRKLWRKIYFPKGNTDDSCRCIIELDGDTLVCLAWRKHSSDTGLRELVVKAINPDPECLEILASEDTLSEYNVTAIGERYEAEAPNHPYKKET